MARIKKRWYHGMFRWYGATRFGAWANKKMLQPLDQWMMRRSGGKRSFSSIFTGLPVVTVKTIGARSGKERTLPLLAIPEGEVDYLLIASNFGRRKNPAWYHNMRKNPRVVLADGDSERAYIAQVVEGEERERHWQTAASFYPGYAQYAKWTDRTIPVLHLTQAPASDEGERAALEPAEA